MPKKRLDVNWKREVHTEDFKPALRRYTRYLEENGLRESTISSYVFRVGKFLEFAQTDEPDADDFAAFQETLYDKRLSRSSINNYCLPSSGIIRCVGNP
ncbi:MAG: phage integrase N-terminal SAM-like domain-containing protein [Methanothrix sp.]|nr:phage integrase N-terminal SAM-like domain-containing protein [Methanothrix sp.]